MLAFFVFRPSQLDLVRRITAKELSHSSPFFRRTANGQRLTPFPSTSSTLFAQTRREENAASLLFSTSCAHLQKTTGVYPLRSSLSSLHVRFCYNKPLRGQRKTSQKIFRLGSRARRGLPLLHSGCRRAPSLDGLCAQSSRRPRRGLRHRNVGTTLAFSCGDGKRPAGSHGARRHRRARRHRSALRFGFQHHT